MEKHAKGPWSLEGVYGGYEVKANDSMWPQGKRTIAKTKNTGKDEVEFRANAHLIAAAPDLLEALKNCVTDANQNLTKQERLKRIRYAQEAISRAQGN